MAAPANRGIDFILDGAGRKKLIDSVLDRTRVVDIVDIVAVRHRREGYR